MRLHRDIANAIKNKLNGSSYLNGVYVAEVPTPTNGQYPYATIVLKRGQGKFGDTIRNDRLFKFGVNVYQERTATGQGPLNAETIIIDLVDEIVTAFDADTTLSGLVSMVTPVSFDANYDNGAIGDTRILQFDIEGRALVPAS